jgi:hypothetical protein
MIGSQLMSTYLILQAPALVSPGNAQLTKTRASNESSQAKSALNLAQLGKNPDGLTFQFLG